MVTIELCVGMREAKNPDDYPNNLFLAYHEGSKERSLCWLHIDEPLPRLGANEYLIEDIKDLEAAINELPEHEQASLVEAIKSLPFDCSDLYTLVYTVKFIFEGKKF